jgi:hypothetical protein
MEETGDEEKEVSSYWMTLRKYRILEFERGSSRSHSQRELVVELAVYLSQDSVMNE